MNISRRIIRTTRDDAPTFSWRRVACLSTVMFSSLVLLAAWVSLVMALIAMLDFIYRLAFSAAFGLILSCSTSHAASLGVDQPGEAVSICEINHCHFRDRSFVQLVYRDRHGLIRDWRYLGPATVPRDGWAFWSDDGKQRLLFVERTIETWTDYDVEREETYWRSPEVRRRLFATERSHE